MPVGVAEKRLTCPAEAEQDAGWMHVLGEGERQGVHAAGGGDG